MVPGREGGRMHPDHPVDPVQGPEPFFASAAEGQDWLSGWQSWGWFGCDERPRGPGHNRDAVGAGFEWDPGFASFLGQPWATGRNAVGVEGTRGGAAQTCASGGVRLVRLVAGRARDGGQGLVEESESLRCWMR